MSWESRGGSQRYLYVVRREGQRLKKTYVGKGYGAILAAKEIEKQAEKRRQNIQEVRDFEAELWALDHSMKLFREAARQALHTGYFLAGYKQTLCSHWTKGVMMGKKKKRRRETTSNSPEKQEPTADPVEAEGTNNQAEPNSTAAGDKPSSQKPLCVADTIQEMKAGRTELLGHLKWQLSQVPQLWRQVGDISRLTIESWARQIAGDDILLRESIVLCAMEERTELVSDNATSMERVIADRVVVTRLQRQFYELFAANTASDLLGAKLGDAVEKRLKSANHEFREAARHLSKIRELQSEISPDGPAAGTAAALKVFDPDQLRKTA